MRTETIARYPKLCVAAEKSRTAAIKLFCRECVGYNTAEVRRCEVHDCPLHRYRMGAGTLSDAQDEMWDTEDTDEPT